MLSIKPWMFLLLSVLFVVPFGEPKAQNQIADIVIGVRGMVCSFCVQGVEKKLLAIKGVRSVVVKLKEKTVQVWLKEDVSVADQDLKTAIEAAGYNLENIVRAVSSVQTSASKTDETAPSEKSQRQ